MWALCCDTKGYVTMGVWKQFGNSKSFPSQHGTLTKCWFNVGQRRRRWSNIKTALGQFLVGVVVSCNQFSAVINAVKVYSKG